MSVYTGCSRIFSKISSTSLVLLALQVGCGGGSGGTGSGGGGGSGPPGPPPETTVPTVTAMSPGEDTGGDSEIPGIGTNSKLTATFSEAMIAAMITAIDPVTNNPANFRLSNGFNSVPGTVSYDATNHIAVFTPTSELAPGTRYTATIITGIKDLAGNPLTTDFAWCFVTAGTPDNTAPSVTSTIPTNAFTGVAINRKISATFSEEMNSSTLTAASFTVKGPGATAVSGTVIYLGRTAVFTPAQDLAALTVYTATITTGARDLAGNASANVAWTFTTGAAGANVDVNAPFLVSTNPANFASGVAINATISVTLSEPMDPATLTTANFAVTGPGATLVIGTVAFDATNNTATFTRINHLTTPVASHPTPVSNLERNTQYTATLTTGARDMAGNALASNVVWSFTTAP